jgi:hypothetical protein
LSVVIERGVGDRLCGPGTAIAIAANTFYSVTPGPEGVALVNFRAGLPSEVRFADGRTADEVGVWGLRLDRPLRYLMPESA